MHGHRKSLDRDCLLLGRRDNVRKLRNAIEHAAIIAPSPESLQLDSREGIHGQSLTERFTEAVRQWTETSFYEPKLQSQLLELVEPALIETILTSTNGNGAQAAAQLGIHCETL